MHGGGGEGVGEGGKGRGGSLVHFDIVYIFLFLRPNVGVQLKSYNYSVM